MSTITTRSGKGSPLTHNEVDANFTNLNTDKLQSGDTAASLTVTSADINGGTIDGTVIGGSTPAAATFSSLVANSLTYPTTDGTSGQAIITDGSGALSFGNVSGGGGLENVVEDTTPQLGGTLDANGNNIDMGVNVITDTKVGQWDTAYGWGDHSTAGYLTTVSVDGLSDATITTPADNELLAYNSATSEWINQTPTEAGFATVATSGAYSDLSGTPTNVSTFTNDAGYLTAEADTLDSVTGRGATTTNAVTVGNLTSTGIDVTGNVTIDSAIYRTDTGAGGIRFTTSGNIRPVNNAGTSTDLALDIGDPSFRFNDLYLGGDASVDGAITSSGLTATLTSGYIRIQDLNSAVVSGTDMGGIEWRTGDSSVSGANRITASISAIGDGTFNAADKAPTALTFSTHGTSGVSPAERMRIDSSGNVGIGTTVAPGANGKGLAIYDALYPRLSLRNSTTGDTNTDGLELYMAGSDVYYDLGEAGNQIFLTNGQQRMRIDSSGNVGIGTTSPETELDVVGTITASTAYRLRDSGTNDRSILLMSGDDPVFQTGTATGTRSLLFKTEGLERMRIDASGNLLVGKTVLNANVPGIELRESGIGIFTVDADTPVYVNRESNDGDLIVFRQDNVTEGTISVSGTTVSYNGGHLSRWSQSDIDDVSTIYKGTVMSNLDEMCEWDNEDNEQLNKTKVSDVEGDVNVAGVFVAEDNSDDLSDYYLAMTGDMIIRIAQGITVQRGDLLMSAGDGTAKPQDDDIVRSKTIAKVTSTNVTCTYADGSYCVPCVLMAC